MSINKQALQELKQVYIQQIEESSKLKSILKGMLEGWL